MPEEPLDQGCEQVFVFHSHHNEVGAGILHFRDHEGAQQAPKFRMLITMELRSDQLPMFPESRATAEATTAMAVVANDMLVAYPAGES